MIIKDDRTDEQRITHNHLVFAVDNFMSGWGMAEGGVSYVAWACEKKDIDKVYRWVRNRSEMRGVRVIHSDYKPSGTGHYHVYVVHDNHPALGG